VGAFPLIGPYEGPEVTLYVGGEYSKVEQVELTDLFAVVDLTEDLMRADLALGGCADRRSTLGP
jgi:hypothetical protein